MRHTQQQHATDARRLIQTAQNFYEERDTNKCLENAEFGMEQISRKPISLLPAKDKFLQELYNIVANAFLDQVRAFMDIRLRYLIEHDVHVELKNISYSMFRNVFEKV